MDPFGTSYKLLVAKKKKKLKLKAKLYSDDASPNSTNLY